MSRRQCCGAAVEMPVALTLGPLRRPTFDDFDSRVKKYSRCGTSFFFISDALDGTKEA